MTDIVLATLNARYTHCALGLRYLWANLAELQPVAQIIEFQIQQRPIEIVETLLAVSPRIVGFGVYIWNRQATLEVIRLLRRLRPKIILVLGGPEVSYAPESCPLVEAADYVISGEADVAFASLCRDCRQGTPPPDKILTPPVPDLESLQRPYALYSDHDLTHRTVYVEASRGCPFHCEFCLSSLDIPVRAFPLDPLLEDLDGLYRRGLHQFKFVDRTFNLNLSTSRKILEFFLARYRPGLFVHLEMIPDRFPVALRDLVGQFPPGSLQFEVGVQTFNPEVSERIHRRQDYAKTVQNLRSLRDDTGVHLHTDLIIGLPGETVDSFARGFDQLVQLRPQEIQLGILKRLQGTPIGRHDEAWEMIYSPEAPYEVLENRSIDFSLMRRLHRLARYWDLVANSGNFQETTTLIWEGLDSPFAGFLQWSDWLHETLGQQHGIALNRLAQHLAMYLTQVRGLPESRVAAALNHDYDQVGRERPPFLRDLTEPRKKSDSPGRRRRAVPRQERHGRD